MKPAVVILAGGEGRRIGGFKPMCRLGGRTLLDRAIDLARGWSDEVAIAVRTEGQIGDPGIVSLLDPPGLEGPLGGLASALQLGRETILTIPCDSPFLPYDLPERLVAALPGYRAALARSGGRIHPVCGLWRADALRQIRIYAASGRRSLMGFADSIGYSAVDWPEEAFFNINSAADLAEAESRLG